MRVQLFIRTIESGQAVVCFLVVFFYYIKVNCKNDNFIQADHLELH